MMQLPLFAPESDWVAPNLSDLPEWKGRGRVGFDCETIDPTLKKFGPGVRTNGKMVGVSFAFEDDNFKDKFYLPFRHKGGDNMDEVAVKRYLKHQMKHFDGQVVGANLSYDLDYSAEEDLHFENASFMRDVQIAEPLIDELQFSYSLKNIGDRHGIKTKDETLIREAAIAYGVDPKAGIGLLPARFVGTYAERDVTGPLELLRRQEKIIERDNLWQIFNLESRVLPILVKMRRRGVKIDQDKLAQVEEWALKQEAEALEYIRVETGVDIGVGNVWKAVNLAPALEAIGVRVRKTAKGQPNIDIEILAGIDHPVAERMAWARKVNKLRTTFAASIRRHMINGRIHCTFNQMARETEAGNTKGARYGRLSCVDPNLQQQPSRDEFAAFWRSIYIPDDGAIWGCLDYSQQEPRWTTHFASLIKLPKAEAAAKQYRDDPTTDNHTMMANLTGVPRKQAKAIYLGLCYGKGGASMCDELGLPTRWAVSETDDNRRRKVHYVETQHEAMTLRMELSGETFAWRCAGKEGQEILDKFDKKAPYVKKLAQAVEKKAKKVGYITTICGRRLHFPEGNRGYDFTYRALNRLIQGSSADQTKTALVEADAAGHYIQLQVHDEFDGSFATVQAAKDCAEIMKNCIPDTQVPFNVDVEIGPSWGEIKDADA